MKASSPLLRLPRELRNEIYKHALYHAEGLLCTIGRNGVGRLYERTGKMSSRNKFWSRFRDRSRRVKITRNERRGREYNQLKYVCKLLRDETSGLSLHGNILFTEDSPTVNAFEQCLILLRRFPWLPAVAIKCCIASFASESSQGKLFETIRSCAARADVTVRVHIPHWSLIDPDFVFRGLSYQFSLRRDARLLVRLAQTTSVTYLANSASEMLTADPPIPINVRFYPWEDAFDPQLFEQICRKQPLLGLPSTQAAIGNVESLVRGWIEHGL